MVRRRVYRVILGVVLLGGLLAIYLSFKARHEGFLNLGHGVLLPSEVDRKATAFEYKQMKGDRPVFEVQASVSTLLSGGLHELEEVTLLRFGAEGERSDSIKGHGATYDQQGKTIEFNGDVNIELAGGIRVFADRAGADLTQELITIKGRFKFERGDVSGEGAGLSYDLSKERLLVTKGMKFQVPPSLGGGDVGGEQFTYAIQDSVLQFLGKASVTVGDDYLGADQIEVLLDERRRVQKVRAVGNAKLITSDQRQFSGQEILLSEDENDEGSITFKVVAGTGSEEPARYEDLRAPSSHLLEASVIEGEIGGNGPEIGARSLKQLEARERVMLQSEGLGISDCRTEKLKVHFSDSKQPERIEMEGNVKLLRRTLTAELLKEESLRSEELQLQMDGKGRLQRALAGRNVEVELNAPGVFRHLRALKSCLLEYKEGVLQRVVAEEDCRLESIVAGERDVVRAPEIEGRFESGEVKNVLASGGVELEFFGAEGIRQSVSDELELHYKGLEISEAVQRGGFRFQQASSEGTLELVSEVARYTPSTRVLVASGPGRSVLRTSTSANTTQAGQKIETVAETLRLDTVNSRIFGSGKVHSIVGTEDGPLVVRAEEMEADLESGWVTYSSSPRLVQGQNLIQGDILRIHEKGRRLIVEGSVKSLLIEGDETKGESRRYEIVAGRLEVTDQGGKATYQDDVKVTSEKLTVAAPTVEILFAEASQRELAEIIASGGVEIREGERLWKGRKATYYRKDERVVVQND